MKKTIPERDASQIKVLYITPYFLPHIGGAEVGLYNLCEALNNIGVRSFVLTNGQTFEGNILNKLRIRPRINPQIKNHEKIGNVTVFRYKPIIFLRFINSQLAKISNNIIPVQHIEGFFKAYKIIKDENVDIIHLHCFNNTSIIGFFAKKILKKPLIANLIGDDIYDPIVPVHENQWKYYSRVINKSSAIVAACTFGKKLIKEKTGKEDIKIIPWGIDTNKFKRLEISDTSHLKKKYDIADTDKVVIAVQRPDSRKKVEILIHAAKKVIDKIPNTKFLIVGDGPERAKLENLTKELHLAQNVIFTGKISEDELIRCYSIADIFSIHTLHEGFGIVYIEAMSMGLPIVTTYAHGNEDIIENGKNGFMVEPNNPDKLAEKIIFLLVNDEIRNEIARHNREEAVEKYDLNNIARRWKELYCEVLSR